MKIKKKYFIHYILPILFLLFNKYAVSAPLCYEEIESNINEETISEETSLSKENRNNVEQNNKRKNINEKEEDDAPNGPIYDADMHTNLLDWQSAISLKKKYNLFSVDISASIAKAKESAEKSDTP